MNLALPPLAAEVGAGIPKGGMQFMWSAELAVMALMIAFNSVFAAYEIALASITLSRLHALVGTKAKGAAAALYMKEKMEGSLAGVQLGITLVGATAAAIGGVGASESIAPYFQQAFGMSSNMAEVLAVSAVVAPLTVVTIIFGELIPKVFALRNNEWVCLRLSPPMRWFVFAVWPVVWALETAVTRLMSFGEQYLKGRLKTAQSEASELHELRASVALARTSRLIGPQEERIILVAAALSHRPIREVMLPANFISMVDVNVSVADALIAAHLDMHTRFPVTERPGDAQGIVGYVNFKDLVAFIRMHPSDSSVREIMRTIPVLPADHTVAASLERLIRERTHIAIVQDGAGAIVGMVTLEDIIEELVGDIEDEFDSLPIHVVKVGAGWVVGGGVGPDKLRSATGLQLPTTPGKGSVRHLSEWVVQNLSHPLHGGETIEREGISVVVRKIRRQMVQEAFVRSI
jgi:putative hemolysin